MTGHVIVVDDEAAIREAVQQWLELSGFRVHSCATAQAALALVDRDYPGIIISDVRMPGTDGLQLLDSVLERDRDLPVILITGHGDVPMAVQALRQGAYDFIEKPFTPSACSTACAAPWTNAVWSVRTASCGSSSPLKTISRRSC